ncbi:hypothetical protein Q9R32_12685 [Actinotalea sp. AC32]|nr:hypothetical protein [Actinotalea sp. AC32]
MRTRTALAGAAAAALLTGVTIGAAVATPSSTGDLRPTSGTQYSGVLEGSTTGPTKAKQDGVELKTQARPTTVTTFDLTYPAGSWSGWHAHPGIVVVVVKSGTVVRETPCESETFTAGDAFTEVGPHNVTNPGTEPAILAITRIYPTDRTAEPRIDLPEPACR